MLPSGLLPPRLEHAARHIPTKSTGYGNYKLNIALKGKVSLPLHQDWRRANLPGDPVDQYLISGGGAISPGTQTFPIQNRLQIPPTETSIGVRLVWNYSPPAGIFPKNMQIVEYAVMKAAPVLV